MKCNFTDLDLTGVLGALLTKKTDLVISGITITQDRAKRFDISIPYSEAGAAILVRADETRMRGPDDLSGKVIGTQIGSSSQKAAEAFDAQLKAQGKPGYAELKTYERFPTAHQDLLSKRLDAVVQGRPPLKVLIKERPNLFKIFERHRPEGVLRRRRSQGRHRAARVHQRPDPQVQAGRDAQGAPGEVAGRVGRPHPARPLDAAELARLTSEGRPESSRSLRVVWPVSCLTSGSSSRASRSSSRERSTPSRCRSSPSPSGWCWDGCSAWPRCRA